MKKHRSGGEEKGISKQSKENKEIQLERKISCRNKALHGRYFVATDELRVESFGIG